MKHNKNQQKPALLVLRNLFVALLVGAAYFYFTLPAINYKDQAFYTMFAIMTVVFLVLQIISLGVKLFEMRGEDSNIVDLKPRRILAYWSLKVPLILLAVMVVAVLAGNITGMEVFRAREYAALLQVENGDFTAEVEQISFDQIPMLDKDSAERLGDRKLGELSDMVSQFEVNPAYSQINFQDEPVRVTYLDYGDIIKWFNNRQAGLPAYIRINMVSQEVTVERLSEGMKYSPSDLFFRDLMRHLRFSYPTVMFDDVNFEINEEGHPYWICSVVDKTIGLFGGVDVIGAVLVDAITGESDYYALNEIPTWVDRVFPADLIMTQYDYRGTLSGGFLNSIFGQKNVTVTTEGYNYIAINDDVWLYTGITSVTGDESNVGFILSNQRTKQTSYYPIAGATEYSARASAMGMVQHLNYVATFPLLLNISGEPTYFMALKDASELVKMYAMVNVEQYQVVATGQTLEETNESYRLLLEQNGIETDELADEGVTVLGATISEIRSQVIDGTTVYYFRVGEDTQWYSVSAADFEEAVLLQVGTTLRFDVKAEDASILPVSRISIE